MWDCSDQGVDFFVQLVFHLVWLGQGGGISTDWRGNLLVKFLLPRGTCIDISLSLKPFGMLAILFTWWVFIAKPTPASQHLHCYGRSKIMCNRLKSLSTDLFSCNVNVCQLWCCLAKFGHSM